MFELVTLDLAFVGGGAARGKLGGDRNEGTPDCTGSAKSINWIWRQHAQGEFLGQDFNVYGARAGHHWLLDTLYGRDVLKAYLVKMQPDIAISKWKTQPELNVWLERVIDVLQLRDLEEPEIFSEHVRYVGRMSKLLMGVEAVKTERVQR